ncbi:MAG: hypothetical protein V3V17_08520, partial [Alphaproteobacteria bacterium]
ENGERAGLMVFDMADPTQIPQIAEPFFLNVDAAVEFVPVMNADDLRKALEKVPPGDSPGPAAYSRDFAPNGENQRVNCGHHRTIRA